jgi:glucosamine-6-phosphate deaminase
MSSTNGPLRTAQVDRLAVRVYRDRQAMGEAAGTDVAATMRAILARQAGVRIVFAAAPSQNETLETLARCDAIDWSRVTAFHMDEYLGLPADAPESFGRFLSTRLFDRVRPGIVHLIDTANEAASECERYARLLETAPIDIVCLGIGENGHLAFNDPPVADFADPVRVKAVALDLASRQQQVHDGCFPTLDAVPTHALTLTIPALMAGANLFCVVPGRAKAGAIRGALHGPVSPVCPASILRRHPNCTLYLDMDSFGLR